MEIYSSANTRVFRGFVRVSSNAHEQRWYGVRWEAQRHTALAQSRRTLQPLSGPARHQVTTISHERVSARETACAAKGVGASPGRAKAAWRAPPFPPHSMRWLMLGSRANAFARVSGARGIARGIARRARCPNAYHRPSP